MCSLYLSGLNGLLGANVPRLVLLEPVLERGSAPFLLEEEKRKVAKRRPDKQRLATRTWLA